MKKIPVKVNESFKEVHGTKKRYIVMKGSAGSGKSVDTAQQYILRILSDKGRNLLCVRKADVTNRYSTYTELTAAIRRMKLEEYFKTTVSPLKITCVVNGNEIIFRGVNGEKEREKLKSITFAQGKLTDVWIEEATELNRKDLDIIDDRLRGELQEDFFYQIKMTFNPVSSNHWIKRDFFDKKDENVLTHHSTYLDNRFIDKAYGERMERRRILDPDGYRIYGLGEWGETRGLILNNWSTLECWRDSAFYDAFYYGQDFGFNHANAILAIGFKDGDIYITDEIYENSKTTDELIALAENKSINKKSTMYCDSAEPDRIKMWRNSGFNAKAVVKESGCIGSQIDFLKNRKIFVDPRCSNTCKELSQWKWKYDSKRDVYLDEPVEYFDDAMAALRYGVEGMRKASKFRGYN